MVRSRSCWSTQCDRELHQAACIGWRRRTWQSLMPGSGSAHGWGVAETLALGRRLQPEKMPARVDILGIEAGDVHLGEGLSPEVAMAMA